ncbi:hypothetical protein LINPERPRIM_LOCUS39969 [Linum perenne]
MIYVRAGLKMNGISDLVSGFRSNELELVRDDIGLKVTAVEKRWRTAVEKS